MTNSQIVLLTSDTDCDGTAYGAHLVHVPAHRSLEMIANPGLAADFAVASGQLSSYEAEGVYGTLTVAAFRTAHFPVMRQWDRDYFLQEGYTSAHMRPRWNPWVYDDTIGIPALDTRYE